MTPDSVISHVRRYPRWYAAAGTWLALVLFAPVVGADVIPVFSSSPQPVATVDTGGAVDSAAPAPVGTPPVTTPRPVFGSSGAPAPAPPSGGDDATPAPVDTSDPSIPESTTPETVPPEQVPPDPLDPLFDAIPVPQVGETPPELMPVLNAISPIANYGCSATGLAALVIAVVAPSVDGVPLERLLPYLTPVTQACANFPIPQTHTECEFDGPFIIDVGGLTKTPPILGVGIDTIEAIETQLIEEYGIQIPRISDQLREQLNCEIVGG